MGGQTAADLVVGSTGGALLVAGGRGGTGNAQIRGLFSCKRYRSSIKWPVSLLVEHLFRHTNSARSKAFIVHSVTNFHRQKADEIAFCYRSELHVSTQQQRGLACRLVGQLLCW